MLFVGTVVGTRLLYDGSTENSHLRHLSIWNEYFKAELSEHLRELPAANSIECFWASILRYKCVLMRFYVYMYTFLSPGGVFFQSFLFLRRVLMI